MSETAASHLATAAASLRDAPTPENTQRALDSIATAANDIGPEKLKSTLNDATKEVEKVAAEKAAKAAKEKEAAYQQNLKELGRILENEAGAKIDRPAMEAIGHTVLNRMARNGATSVKDVASGYAKGNNPTQPATEEMAKKLLDGKLPDITHGATHFYQPKDMRKELADHLTPEKAKEGYELVPGNVDKDGHQYINKPAPWAKGMVQVDVTGVPEWNAKFFISRWVVMYTNLLFSVIFLISITVSPAFAQPPPGPDGYALPPLITDGSLAPVYRAMVANNCQTGQCRGFLLALTLYDMESYARTAGGTLWIDRPAPAINYYNIKGIELNTLLLANRDIWPEICHAVMAIGARDDFQNGEYSNTAASSLDIARRITTASLDCFAEVLHVMPVSHHLDDAIYWACRYCINESGSPARCARLKQLMPKENQKYCGFSN